MMHEIARKRTRREQLAWQQVHRLMPRAGKTRGLQYEVLDYLFARLYEKVSEAELADHLRAVKGTLQKTGDPVKGAINLALKELQRLPSRDFDLIKIQESDSLGRLVRYVRLHFNAYDTVIDFDEYCDYLADLLAGEHRPVVRLSTSHLLPGRPVFPGFSHVLRPDHGVEALLCLSARARVRDHHWTCRFVPDSPLGAAMLLLYADAEAQYPFIGFLADDGGDTPDTRHFLLYRGQNKLSRLKFLDGIWRASYAAALAPADLDHLEAEAERRTDSPADRHTRYLGLVAEHFHARGDTAESR